jgi:hypothetical protein
MTVGLQKLTFALSPQKYWNHYPLVRVGPNDTSLKLCDTGKMERLAYCRARKSSSEIIYRKYQ